MRLTHTNRPRASHAFVIISLALAVGCEKIDPEDHGGAAQSETAAQPAATSGGDFNLSAVQWIGPNHAGSQRDERAVLHSASINLGNNTVRLSYNPLPSDWPLQVNAPGKLCLFEQLPDGSWRGGKFEWLDPGQSVKSLNNINNGYNGWRRPAVGSRIAVVILSTNGRRHSNPAFTEYR